MANSTLIKVALIDAKIDEADLLRWESWREPESYHYCFKFWVRDGEGERLIRHTMDEKLVDQNLRLLNG